MTSPPPWRASGATSTTRLNAIRCGGVAVAKQGGWHLLPPPRHSGGHESTGGGRRAYVPRPPSPVLDHDSLPPFSRCSVSSSVPCDPRLVIAAPLRRLPQAGRLSHR